MFITSMEDLALLAALLAGAAALGRLMSYSEVPDPAEGLTRDQLSIRKPREQSPAFGTRVTTRHGKTFVCGTRNRWVNVGNAGDVLSWGEVYDMLPPFDRRAWAMDGFAPRA